MSNKKLIANSVSNLIKSGAVQQDYLYVPKYETKDIWHKHLNLFSNKLQNDMSNMVTSLVHQYNEIQNYDTAPLKRPYDPYPDVDTQVACRNYAIEVLQMEPEKVDLYRTVCKLGMEYDYSYYRKIALVHFFGCTMDKNKRDATAAKAIAAELEPLAKQDFIMGALCKLSKMRLMDDIRGNKSSRKIIMTYVAITDQGEKYLQANPSKLEFLEGEVPPELP